MFSHRFHFLMRDSPTDFTHRSYGAFKGVHLSPLGFAACQSKKCTNTTKSIFSHRIQNRTFLLGILPQISQNTQNFLAEIFSHRFHIFTQNFLAEKNSVKSVDSVGKSLIRKIFIFSCSGPCDTALATCRGGSS